MSLTPQPEAPHITRDWEADGNPVCLEDCPACASYKIQPCPKPRKRVVLSHREYELMRRWVMARDGWRCRVPGCIARTGLHGHHILFRSQGGDDTSHNLITICNQHHEDIHMSRLKILPLNVGEDIDANRGVKWRVLSD
jgi:hypothetical protein